MTETVAARTPPQGDLTTKQIEWLRRSIPSFKTAQDAVLRSRASAARSARKASGEAVEPETKSEDA